MSDNQNDIPYGFLDDINPGKIIFEGRELSQQEMKFLFAKAKLGQSFSFTNIQADGTVHICQAHAGYIDTTTGSDSLSTDYSAP
jgi:hypothetical protein